MRCCGLGCFVGVVDCCDKEGFLCLNCCDMEGLLCLLANVLVFDWMWGKG